MDCFIRGVAAVSKICGVVAALLIALSVLVICHMVAMRYFLRAPTIWQTECVTYALIAATLIGSPYVLLVNGHVNMDIVPLIVGPRIRWWLAVVAAVLSLGFCVALAIYGFQFWHEAWSKDWHSDSLWRPPLWLPYAALPVGLGVLALQSAAGLAALITGRVQPFAAHGEAQQ
ncbi:MAG: TRAP transporter small permease subunit [Azospirillum sp.]|nr:TRAP transporter small permease subunit [Azospirillum sp.]